MITFDPVEHRYFNSTTRDEYLSVSKVIEKFKKKFDVEYWSKHVANKQNMTVESVVKNWDNIRDTANDKGKRIHKLIEEYLKTGEIDNTPFFTTFLDTFNKARIEGSKICSEQLVYSHIHRVAGTADIIEDCGKYFNIYDIKTNKRFEYYNAYDERLLPPFDFLQQCQYNTYSIQVSLYAYMYNMLTGKHVGKLCIVYNNLSEWNIIPVVYMKDTVEKMLEIVKS